MLKIVKKIWMPIFLLGSLIFIGQYFYNQADRLNEVLYLAPRFLIIATVFQLIYWFVTVHCWQRIVIISTRTKISFMQAFSHIALVTLGKYFPGKIWGMVARASLMKQQGIDLHQSFHATFNEQLLLLHASALLSIALFCAITPNVYTISLCVLGAGSVIMIVPMQRIAFRVLARFSKKSWHKDLQGMVPLTFRQSTGLLAGYSMVWLTIGLVFCCICFSLFKVNPTFSVVMQLLLANTLGITIGFFAVFAPGGLGVREAVTSALLASELPLGDALLLSLFFRLWIIVFEVISGISLLIPSKAGAVRSVPPH